MTLVLCNLLLDRVESSSQALIMYLKKEMHPEIYEQVHFVCATIENFAGALNPNDYNNLYTYMYL